MMRETWPIFLSLAILAPQARKNAENSLLSAVDLLIFLDFQAPESTHWQINRFGLFVSPPQLSICQSLDLVSRISENNSGISIFGFCTIFWETDSGMYFLPSLLGPTVGLVLYQVPGFFGPERHVSRVGNWTPAQTLLQLPPSRHLTTTPWHH